MSKNSEHHDTYIIPPNFIEGSTLFGGMLKIRNVIEAGVLAAAVGVPVFSLDLSLTVRIIILCLTALPLALFALMGVSGEPLSSYVIAFFKWLKNRRVVGKTEPKEVRKKPKPKKGKQPAPENESMLSEIAGVIRKRSAKKKHTEKPRAAKTPKREKPHRRSKADSPFLNPVAEYLPIEKIANGIIYTKDHRYIKLIEVVPINFLLRSAREQRSIIYSFISYLKISPVRIQFKVLTKRADLNKHTEIVRREMEAETDPNCRSLQEDYLKLINRIGSREATTRRFFVAFEYEQVGRRGSNEEADAIASLQTAARTAANYLKQCGNEVLTSENEDEFTVDVLYNILCRQESSDIPLPQRVQDVLSSYIAAGKDTDAIPCTEFFAPQTLDFTHAKYICVDGQYRSYLLIPSYGYKSQVAAGWLSLLVNAGDGIDIDLFLTRQPKERMVNKLGQQLRINRSKIREASDTNSDFDDLDGAIRSGYFLKEGLSNNEDFYYMNILITMTADNAEDLEWREREMRKLLISQDLNIVSCSFREEQGFLSSLPLTNPEKHLYERSKRNVLTSGAASCYPFTAYELSDDNGILLGVNKYNNSLVIVDIFNSAVYKNANIAIMGTSGAGKTFTLQLMLVKLEKNLKGTEYTEMIRRQNKLLSNMLGCEIDFIVKGVDQKTRTVVASRKEAMLKKRQVFYMNQDASGAYRIYEGRTVQARVIAVAEKAVRIEAFGVECSIMARDLSWDWIGDANDRFSVGDQILVRILEVNRDSLEELSIRADVKSVSENTNRTYLKQCRVQSKYAGKVTDVHKGVVYVRLNNGANAIAHTCLDRRTPGKKDDVSFAVTHIDEDRGVAVGIITRIIKQHYAKLERK